MTHVRLSELCDGVTTVIGDDDVPRVFLADWRDAVEVELDGDDRVSLYFWPERAKQPSGGGDPQVVNCNVGDLERLAYELHRLAITARIQRGVLNATG